MKFTIENVREWLLGAPHEPGPMAENLRGFCIDNTFFCTRCCGRLSGRGIILPPRSAPVWVGQGGFAICGACGNPAPGQEVAK